MATSRPFAYNIGGSISGTLQVGSLAIGTPTMGFESTGLEWWNGPDEDLGYVIALPVGLDNQSTPVPGSNLYLDLTHKATDITVSNSDQSAEQNFSYQQSVLGLTNVSGAGSYMISIKFQSSNPSVGIGSRFIGIGTLNMNYNSTFNSYPGNDGESLGFSDSGNFYSNGSITVGALPSWTDNDIIDIAISGNQIWIRVNGGNWNNNPTSNPESGVDGIDTGAINIFYPVLCPSVYGKMTILNVPKYGYPSGFNFLGNITASVGFIRSTTLTDNSFIDLVNINFDQSFTVIGDALSWVNTNNYWTSYPS